MNSEYLKSRKWEQKYNPDQDLYWKPMYFYVFQRIRG
jgi:hypothetical protein